MIAANNKPHPAKNLEAGWLPKKKFGFIICGIKRPGKCVVAGRRIKHRMDVSANNADQTTFPAYLLVLLRHRLSF